MPLSADVLFAGPLSPEEAAELAQEFGTVGLTAELREVSPRRSLGDIAWLALVAVPLKPFYEQLAKDFASDAHHHLKTLTGKICKRAKEPTGSPRAIVLQDSTTGDLWGGSRVLRSLNDLEWRLQHQAPPPVSLLLTISRQEHGKNGYADTRRFLALARPPLHVDSLVVNRGGHNYAAWDGELPRAISWLSAHLGTTV